MLDSIKTRIDDLLTTKTKVIVSIDGDAAAGKSTLATELAHFYDASVIKMDDFFLQPNQRTPSRLAEPGGNVDYERFKTEIILPLKQISDFSYRPFNCQTSDFDNEILVKNNNVVIVEGSYSQHPYFSTPYDLTIFLAVDEQLQRERIVKRNGTALANRFVSEWIPMEKGYSKSFKIAQKADFVFEISP